MTKILLMWRHKKNFDRRKFRWWGWHRIKFSTNERIIKEVIIVKEVMIVVEVKIIKELKTAKEVKIGKKRR